jgi:hypothetical protein
VGYPRQFCLTTRTPFVPDAVEQRGKALPRLDGVGSGAGQLTNRRIAQRPTVWLKERQTTNSGGQEFESLRARQQDVDATHYIANVDSRNLAICQLYRHPVATVRNCHALL